MKYALIIIRSGAVAQWQDTDIATYPEPVEGMQLFELPGDYEFPDVPTWLVDGALTQVRPDRITIVIDASNGLVLQWRNWLDHDYAELVEGTEEIAMPSDTVPVADPCWFINGVITTVAPPPPPAPPPTAEQVRADRDARLAVATLRIAPLQDAADLDEATAAELALLKKWKQYRIALSRIEQQAGFPGAVDWPVSPEA